MQLRFWQAQAGKELLYQGTLGPGHFALSPSGACAIRSGDERVLEAPGVEGNLTRREASAGCAKGRRVWAGGSPVRAGNVGSRDPGEIGYYISPGGNWEGKILLAIPIETSLDLFSLFLHESG